MLPSNISLSKNIEFLLSRYRHQKLTKQSPKSSSIFLHPSFQPKPKTKPQHQSQQSFSEKQRLVVQDRIKLIRNYSFKKLKAMERRKKKSIESMGRGKGNGNGNGEEGRRYNMSVDSTIQLGGYEEGRWERSREESFESIVEEKLLRRRGTTQYVIKNTVQKPEGENKTLEVKQHCLLDYNYEEHQRKYETKKKQWVASRFPPQFAKSPRGLPAIKNIPPIPEQKLPQQPQPPLPKQPLTIKTNRHRSKNQKQNIITPTITPLNLIKKGPKCRHTKQMYFKRVMKSKTQILKFQDDNISPWDRLPEVIAEEETHLTQIEEDQPDYF